MTEYAVTMQRVGRTRNLPPFRVQADHLDDLAEGIRGKVVPFLGSSNVDVALNDEGEVFVIVGDACNGGEGHWVEIQRPGI